jgi:DNA (cytosine-5)-methyltransferase 1
MTERETNLAEPLKPQLGMNRCYAPLTHLALFNGIGGFQLAANWAGWQNIAHVEINEWCNKVVKQHFPNSKCYTDIKNFDGTEYANTIDVISGGFPCQPYSLAGSRKGKEDPRHLWPQMLRTIREVAPRYVVGENVYGIVNWNGGMVFNEVQADLENEGYEVQPVILPACAVGAPHRRERVWFIAYSNKCTKRPPRTSERTFGSWSNNNDEPQEWREQTEQHNGRNNVLRTIANAGLLGQTERQEQTMGIDELCKEWNVTDPERRRQQERWGLSAPNFRNHYFQTGEPQVEPTLCRGDDGLSDWVDRIKALGNAIVPQVAFEIFKAINMHEASLSGA